MHIPSDVPTTPLRTTRVWIEIQRRWRRPRPVVHHLRRRPAENRQQSQRRSPAHGLHRSDSGAPLHLSTCARELSQSPTTDDILGVPETRILGSTTLQPLSVAFRRPHAQQPGRDRARHAREERAWWVPSYDSSSSSQLTEQFVTRPLRFRVCREQKVGAAGGPDEDCLASDARWRPRPPPVP